MIIPFWFKPALIGSLIIGYSVFLYHKGYVSGSESVTKEWNQEKEVTRKAMDSLRETITNQEVKHRADTASITSELAEARRKAEVSIASERAAYERRLQQSNGRASQYMQMAEAGKVEQGNLAIHAAKLDRTIVEGRELVQELRDTLGLRETELTQLGKQILADRELMNAGEPDGK